jgi:hypothetical protein
MKILGGGIRKIQGIPLRIGKRTTQDRDCKSSRNGIEKPFDCTRINDEIGSLPILEERLIWEDFSVPTASAARPMNIP